MAHKKARIQVGAWKRFHTHGLRVVPRLAGASQEFLYKGFQVEIRLPKRPKQRNWHDHDALINCWTYREPRGRKNPVHYTINQVDFFISGPEKRAIRDDAIGTVNHSLFSRREMDKLNRLTEKYEKLLDEVFQYWIDMLRWKSGMPSLCQFHYERYASSRATYLIEAESKKRFYRSPSVIAVGGNTPIGMRTWRVVQNTLVRHEQVPIWRIYLAEANQKMRVDDIRGVVIDLAIASETLIRALTARFLASPANTAYIKLVNGISITRILEDWLRLGFNNTGWKKLESERKEVKRVMDLRNANMHRGVYPAIDLGQARALIAAVLRFTKYGEGQLDCTL